MAARTGWTSSASAITAWSTASGPRQVAAHAEHDDLVPGELAAGRAAGAAAPQAGSRAPMASSVTWSGASSPKASATPRAEAPRDRRHRVQRVAGRHRARRAPSAAAIRAGGQQRALHLHEDGRRPDRRCPARPARRATASATASAWARRPIASGGKVRRCGRDRPPAPCRQRGLAVAGTRLEHQPMRAERTLGAAGHHQGHLRAAVGGLAAPATTRRLSGGEAAGEIVDAAIALGLAENGDDRGGLECRRAAPLRPALTCRPDRRRRCGAPAPHAPCRRLHGRLRQRREQRRRRWRRRRTRRPAS